MLVSSSVESNQSVSLPVSRSVSQSVGPSVSEVLVSWPSDCGVIVPEIAVFPTVREGRDVSGVPTCSSPWHRPNRNGQTVDPARVSSLNVADEQVGVM